MTYTVVLREEPEGGYTVLVPTLPEIITHGATLQEAMSRAAEAIECAVLGRQDLGEELPEEGALVAIPEDERTGRLLVCRLTSGPLPEPATRA